METLGVHFNASKLGEFQGQRGYMGTQGKKGVQKMTTKDLRIESQN